MLNDKKNRLSAILLTILSGICAYLVIPSGHALAQGWQPVARVKTNSRVNPGYRSMPKAISSYRPTATAYSNPNTSNSVASRRSVSYDSTPSVESSIYPVVRENNIHQTSPQSIRSSEWSNLNDTNSYNNLSNYQNQTDSDNKLSPEVLETIRQLKAEYGEPEPLYQMAPQTTATSQTKQLTSKQSNGLIAPTYETSKSAQTPIDIQSSTITFPAGKNIKIKSLDFRETDVTDALRSLARIININLMLSQGINGKVTVLFNDVTMEEAFNTLLVNYDLSFSWEGKILRIFPANAAPTFTKIFPIQHTSAVEIQPMVNRLLSDKGSSEIDSRTNSIVIKDTKAKLTEIENMIPQLDVQETGIEITSRPTTEVFFLNYADASTLKGPISMISSTALIEEFSTCQASQAGAAGGESSSGRMDMMIITDTPNNLERIRELIDRLDIAPIQVTIDANIYEIDKQKEAQCGIKWDKLVPVAGADGKSLFEVNINPIGTDNPGGTGVFRFGSLDTNQFSAVLAVLNTNSFAKVLSNPVITTLNNKQAKISVGQSIPYVSATSISQEGAVSSTVEKADANIELVVTPSVTGNDEVFLNIQPTISSVLGFTTLSGNSTPNLSNRSADTQVICKNNHTIVIGGMIKTDKNESINKVPVLGSLPGIGKLFQSKTVKESRTELIIFITPHIVKCASPKHTNILAGSM